MKNIGSSIFFFLLIVEAIQAQTYGQDFWNNPNVIWKTNSGTIITAAFARKMHTQGNYEIMERELRGGRKEVKMVPPGKTIKKAPERINWDDPGLIIKDDAGQVLPKGMHHLLLKMNSIKWRIDTLDSGTVEVIFDLGSSRKWKSAWADSNVEYIRDWVNQWKGKQLPDFSAEDLKGNEVNNDVGKNKILVLNFWNSNCGPCSKQMSQLNKVSEAFYDEEVLFLAPNFELPGTINMFLQKQRFDYKVLSNAQSLMSDLKLEYYPTHMIVDENGTILDINVGGTYNIGEEIGKRLSWLLAAKNR